MPGKHRWTLFSLLAPALLMGSLDKCDSYASRPPPPIGIEASLIDCATAESANPLVIFETLTATPICAKLSGFGLPKDSVIKVVLRDTTGAQLGTASPLPGNASGIIRVGAAPRGLNHLTFEIDERVIGELRFLTVTDRPRNFGTKPSQFVAHARGLLELKYRPDSRAFVTGACSDIGRGRATYEPYYCREAEFKIWDVETLSQIGSTLLISSNVHSLAFSPDGASLAEGGGEGQIALWRLGANGPPRFLKTAHQDVWRLVWDPTGERIAVASREPTGAEYAIEIISVSSGASIRVPIPNATGEMAFGHLGELLALGAKNGDVVLIDAVTVRTRATIAGDQSHPAREIAFSPDGRYIAMDVYEGTSLFDVSDLGKARRVGTAYKNGSGLQFSSDGTRLFFGGRAIVSLSTPDMLELGEREVMYYTDPEYPKIHQFYKWVTPSPDGQTSAGPVLSEMDRPTLIVVWR